MTTLYHEITQRQAEARTTAELERIARGAMHPGRKRATWFSRLVAKAKRRKSR